MNELQTAEKQLFELTQKVAQLRKDTKPTPVKNYSFKTVEGDVSLLNLFGDKDILFLVHNMGQGCRYCTLWADGLNSFLPHLESQFAVALVSKDPPHLQRTFANSRNWRYKMASHGGGDYAKEQTSEDRGRYESAEQDARARKRGLWTDKEPVAPWDFRKTR